MSCTSWTKTLNDRNNWQQYDLRKQNADFFSSSVFLRTHPLRLRVFPFMFMLLLLHSPIHSSPIHQHSNSQSYGFLSLCVWVCMRANERKEFAFGAGIRNKQRPRGAIWRRWRRVMFEMGILYRKIKKFNFSTMQFRLLFFSSILQKPNKRPTTMIQWKKDVSVEISLRYADKNCWRREPDTIYSIWLMIFWYSSWPVAGIDSTLCVLRACMSGVCVCDHI